MSFIETVPPGDADGLLAELYEADRTAAGELPNHTRAFSLRPEVYAAWRGLNAAVTANMDRRRYELATLAAARRLRSSYCMLAHGAILAEAFLSEDQVRTAAVDPLEAGLDEVEVAVMGLADAVAADATSVTQADIDRLRSLGLGDEEILDVILTSAMRAFFSKVLDATGALADARFAALEPGLRDALTVGRPIAEA
ncbi:MAG: hypothetical protein QOG77_3570 [Solirubrobacteraceae bacterium]|nr:hypothetical protein [Solirubrobacteraceae bacterium]